MIIPVTARECRPERARRIHRCAGERSAEKDIQRDSQADRQAPDFRRARVHGRTIDHKDQKERQHRFDHDALALADVPAQVGGARSDNSLAGQAGDETPSSRSAG